MRYTSKRCPCIALKYRQRLKAGCYRAPLRFLDPASGQLFALLPLRLFVRLRPMYKYTYTLYTSREKANLRFAYFFTSTAGKEFLLPLFYARNLRNSVCLTTCANGMSMSYRFDVVNPIVSPNRLSVVRSYTTASARLEEVVPGLVPNFLFSSGPMLFDKTSESDGQHSPPSVLITRGHRLAFQIITPVRAS